MLNYVTDLGLALETNLDKCCAAVTVLFINHALLTNLFKNKLF